MSSRFNKKRAEDNILKAQLASEETRFAYSMLDEDEQQLVVDLWTENDIFFQQVCHMY